MAVAATLGVATLGIALIPTARNAVIGLFNQGRAYFSPPTSTMIATPSTTSASSSSSSSGSAGKAKKKHNTSLATASSSSSSSSVNVRAKPASLVEQAQLAGAKYGTLKLNDYLNTIKNENQYKNSDSKYKNRVKNAYMAGAASVPELILPTINVNEGGYVPRVAKPVKPQLSADELAERERLAEEAFTRKVDLAKQRLVKLRGASDAVVSILLDAYGNEIGIGRNGGIAADGIHNAAAVLPVVYVREPNHVNGYGSACAEAHAIVKWSNSGKQPKAEYSLAYGPEGFKSACGTCVQALDRYDITDLIDY